MLSAEAGEVVPLTSDGDDLHPKALINNENVFSRRDVWGPPENVERRTTPASTTITKTRKGFEVTNSSSPEKNWFRGQAPQYADAGRR